VCFAQRRQGWATAYVDAVLTRDLRDIAAIERLADLPKLVQLLAAHVGQLVNYSELGGALGIDYKTIQRYVRLLEQIFLVATVSPWYSNEIKRLIKTPKLHFVDSGILAAVRGVTIAQLKRDRTMFGALLETFVVSEVMKLCTWSDVRLRIYHYRDRAQHEVDVVLENRQGQVVGIEIKAGATVTSSDFSGLNRIAEASRDRFVLGAVLYDSDTVVPFGRDGRLFAAPISCLWS
jgi:hypothetical protein